MFKKIKNILIINHWFNTIILLFTIANITYCSQPHELVSIKKPWHYASFPEIKYTYQFGIATNQGARDYMEDRHDIHINSRIFGLKLLPPTSSIIDSYVGVFDGHGGFDVAEWLKNNLYSLIQKNITIKSLNDIKAEISKTFIDANNTLYNFKKFDHVGSTAVCAITFGDKLLLANVGDSRAVGGSGTALTVDHKPSNETEQKRVGKHIIKDKYGHARLGGQLAITRAFGDFALITYGLTAEPDIYIYSIKDMKPDTGEDPFIILASDGIWDLLSDKEAAYIASQSMNRHPYNLNLVAKKILLAAIAKEPHLIHKLAHLPQEAIIALNESATNTYLKQMGTGSHDNQTVIIQRFRQIYQPLELAEE